MLNGIVNATPSRATQDPRLEYSSQISSFSGETQIPTSTWHGLMRVSDWSLAEQCVPCPSDWACDSQVSHWPTPMTALWLWRDLSTVLKTEQVLEYGGWHSQELLSRCQVLNRKQNGSQGESDREEATRRSLSTTVLWDRSSQRPENHVREL